MSNYLVHKRGVGEKWVDSELSRLTNTGIRDDAISRMKKEHPNGVVQGVGDVKKVKDPETGKVRYYQEYAVLDGGKLYRYTEEIAVKDKDNGRTKISTKYVQNIDGQKTKEREAMSVSQKKLKKLTHSEYAGDGYLVHYVGEPKNSDDSLMHAGIKWPTFLKKKKEEEKKMPTYAVSEQSKNGGKYRKNYETRNVLNTDADMKLADRNQNNRRERSTIGYKEGHFVDGEPNAQYHVSDKATVEKKTAATWRSDYRNMLIKLAQYETDLSNYKAEIKDWSAKQAATTKAKGGRYGWNLYDVSVKIKEAQKNVSTTEDLIKELKQDIKDYEYKHNIK